MGSFAETCLKRVYYSTCLYFFCFVVSAFLIFELPVLLKNGADDGIDDNAQLKDDQSGGYNQFVDHNKEGVNNIHVYFFNITNPDEILNGKLPEVKELGPFIYKDNQIRSNITFDGDKNEVSFRLHSSTEFLPAETLAASGYLSDHVQITTLNMIFFGAQAALARQYYHEVFNKVPDREKMFVTIPARDLLYGYSGKVGSHEADFPGFVPNLNTSVDPDYTNMHTITAGLDDEANFNYKVWRGMKKVEVSCPWGADRCPDGMFPCCILESSVWKHKLLDFKDHNPNQVGGSTGDQFKPDTPDTVSIWLDVLQREMQLISKESITYKGVKCKRFVVDPIEAMNDKEYPRNWQFYQFGRSGLFNMSMLIAGAPAFGSYPHFYGGDGNLSARIIGLNPQKDLHETSIDVEHHTGTTVRSRKRFQISIQIKPRSFKIGSTWFPNLKYPDEGQIVPMFWMDTQGDTKDEDMSELSHMDLVIEAETWVRIIGIVVILISLMCWFYINWRDPENDPQLNSNQSGLNFVGSRAFADGTEPLVDDDKMFNSVEPNQRQRISYKRQMDDDRIE